MLGTFYIYYLAYFYIEKFSFINYLGSPEIHFEGEITAYQEKEANSEALAVLHSRCSSERWCRRRMEWRLEMRCELLLSGKPITSASIILSWLIAEPLDPTSQNSLTCWLPHSVTELCPDSVVQLWGQELHLILLESGIDLARHWAQATYKFKMMHIYYLPLSSSSSKALLKCLAGRRTGWNDIVLPLNKS